MGAAAPLEKGDAAVKTNKKSAPHGEDKLLGVRKFKVGYELRTYEMPSEEPGGKPIQIPAAFNPRGEYIGSPASARTLCVDRGIAPELASSAHRVCSVGYCAAKKTWYGWSHRAICGFKKGDRIFEEDFGDDLTPFTKHGRKTIKTDADARLSAVRFADYVD